MKHIRQSTYVERELIRRRVEKRQMVISKATNGLACIALAFGTVFFLFVLLLM